jgi:hypothetical protein
MFFRHFPRLEALRYFVSPDICWKGGSDDNSYRLWKQITGKMGISLEVQAWSMELVLF